MATEEVRVIVMMSPELRDQLKALAKAHGRVLSRQIEWALKGYVALQRVEDAALRRAQEREK